ncbi:MAG: Stp1/IreP family PP2C-type Ser/Thr phosphatase [Christensenellales bacterium]|jgi:serine/threonine protein phosphatase PrpC
MLKLANRSHTGLVRTLNEDCTAAKAGSPWLLLVADGMGGHSAGEVASSIACSTVEEALRSAEYSIAALNVAVEKANSVIFERSRSAPGCRGMGTTLVFACGKEGEAIVANVGDSRAYHYSHREGTLRQITRDHSLVQELVSAGRMTPEEALAYPYRNVITRAVGTAPSVSADIFEVELSDGDALLLCSDGLTNEVPDAKILETLKNCQGDPEVACATLIQRALTEGGRDNISVAIGFFLEEGGKEG